MISSSCLGHYPILAHARAGIGFELVRDVFPEAGDHGGAWETSLMRAFRPELVDFSRLLAEPDAKSVAVWGKDPRFHASAEFGQRAVAPIVERITCKVGELLQSLG